VKAEHARELAPSIIFGPRFDRYPLRVRHGHEDALFNAPDPTGRDFPLGYFITRFTAKAAEQGLPEMSFSFRTILKSGGEVVRLLRQQPLVDCVFDTVLKATGVKLEDRVVMPDGSSIEVGNRPLPRSQVRVGGRLRHVPAPGQLVQQQSVLRQDLARRCRQLSREHVGSALPMGSRRRRAVGVAKAGIPTR
jgi:hypothetical protein